MSTTLHSNARYIIAYGDKILQILRKKPLFIPENTSLLIYNGDVDDDRLSVVDGVIVVKPEVKVEQLSKRDNIQTG